jgi:hypothetical protein
MLDLIGVLHFDDFNFHVGGEGDPLDHGDGASAFATANSQNLDFQLEPLVVKTSLLGRNRIAPSAHGYGKYFLGF